MDREKHYAFDSAPRCGAKAKGNHGLPCRCPAMKGKTRCRIHGGASGSGAQRGNVNALKHGFTTAEHKAFRKQIKLDLQLAQQQCSEVEDFF
jgi:hypothetical protein